MSDQHRPQAREVFLGAVRRESYFERDDQSASRDVAGLRPPTDWVGAGEEAATALATEPWDPPPPPDPWPTRLLRNLSRFRSRHLH